MKIWFKRYLILTICYVLAISPLFMVLSNYRVFENDTARLVFWIVFPIVTALFYGIMSYFMFKGRK